jgi:hypothetical protein
MRGTNRLAKIAVSFVAAAVLAVRLFKPNLKVDSVVLLLIVIGIVPWLSSLIKSVEFLGFKIEFQESPAAEATAGQGAKDSMNSPAVSHPVLGAKPALDGYTTRLLKYTPVELIVGFIISNATIPKNETLHGFPAVWVLFLVFLALTPIYTGLLLKIGAVQSVLMTLSFCVWVLAIGGPFATLDWYQPLYGGLALAFFTFVVPLIDIYRVH